MPRNERTMADAELIKDRIMSATKNFFSELTSGPRVETPVVSSLRAGDDTFVPTTTKELGTSALILLIPKMSSNQEIF